MSSDNFPAELKTRKQWLVWRFEQSETSSKPRKMPYYVNGRRRSGTQGSDDDRAALSDFATAEHAKNNGNYDGLGFAFLPNDGLIGIDLDGCFNTDDAIKHERAVKIIAACNSYTELSPSKNGVHIIVAGKSDTFKSNELGIEVFCGRQFFTMTGQQRAGSPNHVAEISDETLTKLRKTVKHKQSDTAKPKKRPAVFDNSTPDVAKIESALAYIAPDCGYDEWIRVGMAIHSELGDNGFGVWDYWSAKSSKYSGESDLMSHWRSFKTGSITIASVFKMAMDSGWRPPRANVSPDFAPISQAPVGRIDTETGEIITDEPPPTDEMIYIEPRAPYNVAQQFIGAQHNSADNATLHYWRGDWYVWNRVHYQLVNEDWIRSEIYQWLASCFELKDMMPERVKPNMKLVSEVYHALKAICLIDVDDPPTWIVPPPDLIPASDIIACNNGFLRISTRRLIPARPSLFVTAALAFDARENPAQPVEWLKFLDRIWPDDQQSKDCLAESVGYMLTDDTSQQKMFLLAGAKRSGKGTILRVIEQLVGQHNKVSPSLNSIGTQFGLQPLIGKRIAMISDARLSYKSDQAAIIENLLRITGEDTVSIDRKHRESWNGKLTSRFLMATNELPNFSDASSALASRFIIFRFTRSFYGQEDTTLTDRLLSELPGILMWALDGLMRLRKRGKLIQPDSALDMVQELDEMTSPIGMFIDDCCIIGEAETVLMDNIYDAWLSWCESQGRDHPGNKQSFGKMLSAAQSGLHKSQRRIGGKLERMYTGIRLRRSSDI